MAGLLDWVDPAREWWKSRPEVIKGLLSGAYSMATDQATREAAMARLPKPFDRSVTGEQMMNNALNAGPSGLLGKIVYHGSPHKFDKFDASKIGTGEGAQAYGQGLYFADAKPVAQEYAKTLADSFVNLGGKKIETSLTKNFYEDGATAAERYAAAAWDRFGGDKKEAIKFLSQRGNLQDEKEAAKILRRTKDISKEPGYLYENDLPDEWIPKMLDWDKPLSEQPEFVKSALGKLQETYRASEGQVGPYISPEASGRQVIEELTRMAKWQKSANAKYNPSQRATEELRFLGIPGIRYLDGGSRGNGSILKQFATKKEAEAFASSAGGTTVVQPRPNGWVVVGEPSKSYNYVVFPGLEDQVKILERNGVPLSGLLGR